MARLCNTTIDDGTKEANIKLSIAAGIMSYLKIAVTDIDSKSPDFSEPALNYNQFLILGQSQHILIDAAIRRNLNNEDLSKLCQGASQLYNDAANSGNALNKNLDTKMLKYCVFHK